MRSLDSEPFGVSFGCDQKDGDSGTVDRDVLAKDAGEFDLPKEPPTSDCEGVARADWSAVRPRGAVRWEFG